MYWGIKQHATIKSMMIACYAYLKIDCHCLNHDFIRFHSFLSDVSAESKFRQLLLCLVKVHRTAPAGGNNSHYIQPFFMAFDTNSAVDEVLVLASIFRR